MRTYLEPHIVRQNTCRGFCSLTSKGESKLEKRDCCPPTWTETVVHYADIRVLPAHLCVDDNKTDCPVGDTTEYNQEHKPYEEPSLSDGVWQACKRVR